MGCGITMKKEMVKLSTKHDKIPPVKEIEESRLNEVNYSKKVTEKKFLTTVIKKGNNKKVEDNYKILNKIGKGAFGTVFKVQHKISSLQRAMKIIKKESLNLQDDDKTFLKEIEILIETDHPNIIKIFEYYEDEVNYYLITEYVSGGELYDTIAGWKNFNEEKAGYIMYQILSAVSYLHSKNILHRDLKPENILVEKTSNEDPNCINIKLIDFGTCNFYEKGRHLSLRVGTPYYIAPEVLKKNYNEKVDIWSSGVICYILLVGYPPFNGHTTKEILKNVETGNYDMKGIEWNKISNEAKDLVRKMLMYDPDKRISAQDAIKHQWILKLHERRLSIEVDDGYFSRIIRNIQNFNAREKFQQATLAYIVHFLYSNSELEDLKNVFQSIDKDGNGRLTYNELKTAFEKVFGRHLSDVEITNILEAVDQDKDGYIEYQEFLTATLNRKKLISEEHLRIAFDKFDINKDGYLSKSEIIDVLGTDSEYTNYIVNAVDKNKDGEISYSEFCDMMRKLIYNTKGETLLFESPRKSLMYPKNMPQNKINKDNQTNNLSIIPNGMDETKNRKRGSKLANFDASKIVNNSDIKVEQIEITKHEK